MIDARTLTDRKTWADFAPRLRIADPTLIARMSFIGSPPQQTRAAAEVLKYEGYIQAGGIDWGMDVRLLAETVRALSAAGLSPVFAFLYDEFWLPFFKLHQLYLALMGPYRMLPDFWVWNVDPKKGDAGWKPHRDKGHISLFPDGTPKSLTTWVALSAATPINGCMYCVPANFDPTYGKPNDAELMFEVDAVRALPAGAGDFFIWNQALLHWGSRTSPRANESRVSMAFEFQRADVEPYNQPQIEPLTILSFEERLRLIAKQILQYQHMYAIDPAMREIMEKVVQG